MAQAQFELSQPPQDAVSSLAFASGSPNRLLVSCWDKLVYLYDIQDGDGAQDGEGERDGTLVRTFEHQAPVLNVCFGQADDEAFSGGLDCRVMRLELETGQQSAVGKHDAPVRCVQYHARHRLLLSASWDQTLHIKSLQNPDSPPLIVRLPGRPHALSISPTKAVVTMTSRLVYIYDLDAASSLASSSERSTELPAWQQRESSLKFLTRAVACMPNDAGYATSSVEGRVAVEWFEDTAESQAKKYAFKCHRQPASGGGDIVYPVNSLAFHPLHGTFASGGGDGTVALWDAEAKRRLKQYQKYPNSVAALDFSSNGRYLAIAICPGFETGQEDYTGQGQTKIFIRELGEAEAKGKGAK